MSTSVIIQARTGSTRLPNKMLLPFFENKGILELLLDRIRPVMPHNVSLTVATTNMSGDDAIEALCKDLNVDCYRGSETDVLSRFIEAAAKNNATHVIRICADNVFLDTEALKELITRVEACGKDYASYITEEGIPSIKTHYGFWAEGTTLDALKRVAANTTDSLYHEHVTNYIYTHPEMFTLDLKPISETIEGIEECPYLRLTIDTIEDFKISSELYKHFNDNNIEIRSENILTYMQSRTDLLERMKTVINQNAK